jgi:cytochrome c-type biogenesis protein CcmH
MPSSSIAPPPSAKVLWGRALVFATNGVVTAEAKAAFDGAIALDAKRRCRRVIFLGLAAEQDGDRTQAAATLRALIAARPPDAPWLVSAAKRARPR